MLKKEFRETKSVETKQVNTRIETSKKTKPLHSKNNWKEITELMDIMVIEFGVSVLFFQIFCDVLTL